MNPTAVTGAGTGQQQGGAGASFEDALNKAGQDKSQADPLANPKTQDAMVSAAGYIFQQIQKTIKDASQSATKS